MHNAVRVHRRGSYIVAVGVTVLLAMTACSSSGSGSQGTTPSSSTTSSQDNAAAAAGIQWADNVVKQSSVRPTTLPITTPVSKTIPKGKTLEYISCGLAPCVLQGQQLEQADNLLGWKTKVINTDGSTGQLKTAWQTAVQDKPNGIIYSGQDPSIFATEVPALIAQGTWIGCLGCSTDQFKGLSYAIAGLNVYKLGANVQVAWAIQNSGGKANALIVNLPASIPLNLSAEQAQAAFKAHCPDCTVGQLNIDAAQIQNAPAQIVSYLRAHPATKYVIFMIDDLAAGVPAALSAAGIKDPQDVQLIGNSPTSTTAQYVREGTISADLAFPNFENLFTTVDAYVRYVVGDPVTQNPLILRWLVTAATIPSEYPFNVVADAQSQFEQLWGLSS